MPSIVLPTKVTMVKRTIVRLSSFCCAVEPKNQKHSSQEKEPRGEAGKASASRNKWLCVDSADRSFTSRTP